MQRSLSQPRECSVARERRYRAVVCGHAIKERRHHIVGGVHPRVVSQGRSSSYERICIALEYGDNSIIMWY
ncbi:40S ribosomal protein S12 [Fusarium oxysporum f. sp. albedinis]|nr:40S ribosomal protein S12 [Fusarium oxysporum f. sp. albedinis]